MPVVGSGQLRLYADIGVEMGVTNTNVSLGTMSNTAGKVDPDAMSEFYGHENIVTSGLVLHLDAGKTASYPGTGTTWTDLSGNGNNGTLTNGPTYSSANGGSIVFDGVNDYVLTPVNIDANPNTVSAWFNASAINGERGIVITDNGNWDKGFEITDGVFNIHIGNNLSSTGVSALSNTWYFGTIVYTSISMSFYINGANIWSGGAPGATSGSTVEIGRAYYNLYDIGGGSRFFIGNISQVQIYNRALSAAEVLQNYNATKARYHTLIQDGLVLHLDAGNPVSYPGTGTTWTDLSSQGNNGTLVNGVGYNSDNGGSLVFDGSNDYVETIQNTTESSFTISGWIFYNGTVTSQQPVISKWFFGSFSWMLDTIGTNTIRFLIRGSSGGDAVITTTITPNVWFYFTATYQTGTGTCNLYMDSNFISSGIGRSSLLSPTNKIQIGTKGDSTVEWFNGSISQVTLHNRVLTALEIQQNFNATKTRYGL